MSQSKTVDFYWDIGSTNTYFAYHLVQPIIEETGAEIRYIPFNLGYVFRHHNYVLNEEPRAKLVNRGIDLRRWAKKHNLPIIDLSNPNTHVNQIVLGDITDDVILKQVPKVDRCTTCQATLPVPLLARPLV